MMAVRWLQRTRNQCGGFCSVQYLSKTQIRRCATKTFHGEVYSSVQQEILCADEELEQCCAGSGVVLGRVAELVKVTCRCCVVSWVQRLVIYGSFMGVVPVFYDGSDISWYSSDIYN